MRSTKQFNRLFFNLIKNSVESIQEKAIKDKVSELSGGKGTLIKYTKIS